MREPVRVFNRSREVERHRKLIERLHSPRLQMAFIAALTGASGLLASYLLRIGGMSSMALRYPLAVAVGYLAFLFFLWVWLRWGDGDPSRAEETVDATDLGIEIARGGDSADTVSHAADTSSDGGGFDVDVGDGEGAIIGVVIVAAIALLTALFAVFSIVSAAPVLFAELLVDAALAGGLYRHVRGIDRDRHWLKTAVARTFWRFAAVAVVAAGAGWAIARAVPGADSIGALLH